ncbi:unannotated protein [freshwater metagenome]|uniref:Unannotated protein n=1 Tax=freshwater metagenome TaxID=449393 RepID=A0A6J7L5A7_9ZZZZ|nr:glycosyltransferase [Actinomycetota bacterium]
MTDVHLVLTAPAAGTVPDDEGVRTWLEALARVPAATRRVTGEGVRLPAATAEWAAALGVTISGDTDQADGVTVVARVGDLPSPRTLVLLAAAVSAERPVAVVAPWPDAPDDVACVAVHGIARAALRGAGAGDPAAVLASTGATPYVQHGTLVVPGGAAVPDPDAAGPQPAYGHPAALPATLLHRLLRQTGLPTPEPADTSPRPFLTVVTRTQGTRLLCLEEALTSLAAQACRDLEVVVAAHRVDAAGLAAVRAAVAAQPAWLRERVRVLDVQRPGRSAPLNDALDVARGRYVAVLDDDDLVTPRWVAAFAALEAQAAGTVLRAAALRQDVAPTRIDVDGVGEVVAAATGDPHLGWPVDFAMVDHLVDNATPVMALALPRGVVADLGERFDEELETTEDWDLLLRAAGVTGVTTSPEPTSVYRVWTEEEGSRSLHHGDTWQRGHDRVRARLAERVVLLGGAEADRLAAARERLAEEEAEKFRFAALNEQASADLVSVNEAVGVLRAQLAESEDKRRRLVERVQRLKARLAVE